MAVRECTRRAVDAYDKAHYKCFNIRFRLDKDADIIKDLQECVAEKRPYREFISELYVGRAKNTYTKEQIIATFKDFRGVLTEDIVKRMLDEIE